MAGDLFKVAKQERQLELWIHPQGRVLGSVFIREKSELHDGEESPLDLFNQPESFLVIHREDLAEFRFYNKSSIVRAKMDLTESQNSDQGVIATQMHMMDGSLLRGELRGVFTPDHSRLYDHLNADNGQFLCLYLEQNKIMLINKNYISYAREI